MNELKIHDIKSLEVIPDISFYLFILSLLLIFLVIVALLFLAFKYFRKKENIRKIYYEELKNIDFTNSKESAYKLTKYMRKLARSEREIKISNEIIDDLYKYKYIKNIEKMDISIIHKYELFMESVDV